ncbi:MAG TPA: hypothetical protein VK963_04640 [Candidatus Saccharimonadales bacterium]|nr:hypothetical protein [Candidatus Saccharimonadales bacterium]
MRSISIGEILWYAMALFVLLGLAELTFWFDKKYGYIWPIATVAMMVAVAFSLGLFLSQRPNRILTEQVKEQIHRLHGPLVIRELSIERKAIMYKKKGRLCTARLIQVDKYFFVDEEGAQCADLER